MIARAGCAAIAVVLSLLSCAPATVSAEEVIPPIESTGAYKLLTVEAEVRGIPPGADALLRSVIKEATDAAVKVHRHPASVKEALQVLEAIQLVLVKRNFLQPAERKDWPRTLGEALKPLDRSPEEMERLRAYNSERAEHFDLSKPFYFVDCDMGSQLFLAVAERLGWNVRLVEVPDHNFVRWHLPTGELVNWDWTRGRSVDDKNYTSAVSADVRLRSLYLRSFEPSEATAYFLGLVASRAVKPEDADRLFEKALNLAPPNPTTLNNVAWLYVTEPEFAKDKRKTDLALRYSLDAWSMKPEDGNVADTVACACAAGGRKELALSIEDFAIRHADGPAQTQSFRENLKRIAAGELCQ